MRFVSADFWFIILGSYRNGDIFYSHAIREFRFLVYNTRKLQKWREPACSKMHEAGQQSHPLFFLFNSYNNNQHRATMTPSTVTTRDLPFVQLNLSQSGVGMRQRWELPSVG